MTALATAPALESLPVVGLEELTATAALLTRADRKYLLEAGEVDAILAELPAGTRVLEVHGDRVPAYDTLYLDTPQLDAYFATARRRRRRWKVRQRSYVASSVHFLEVKTRTGALTHKHRLPWAGAVPLGGAGNEFVGHWLTEAGVGTDPRRLTPQLRTTYRRATLLLPGTPTRVTVDVDLTWQSATDGATVRWSDLAIMETKTPGAPSEVDRLLWQRGHRPVSLSKYACGLALLHPELPRNRWHRLLAAA